MMMVSIYQLVCAAAGDTLKKKVIKSEHEDERYEVLMRQRPWEEMWKGMKMMRWPRFVAENCYMKSEHEDEKYEVLMS